MSLVPNDYDRGFNDAMSLTGPCPHCAEKDKRIAEMERRLLTLIDSGL